LKIPSKTSRSTLNPDFMTKVAGCRVVVS